MNKLVVPKIDPHRYYCWFDVMLPTVGRVRICKCEIRSPYRILNMKVISYLLRTHCGIWDHLYEDEMDLLYTTSRQIVSSFIDMQRKETQSDLDELYDRLMADFESYVLDTKLHLNSMLPDGCEDFVANRIASLDRVHDLITLMYEHCSSTMSREVYSAVNLLLNLHTTPS